MTTSRALPVAPAKRLLCQGGFAPVISLLSGCSARADQRQQALAASLSLDPSNVVGLLNVLEERQLITRRRDPADRRCHIVELSPRGEDELCLAYDRLRVIEDDLFSALSAAERATLYDLLVRAVNGASPQCEVADGFGDAGTPNGSDNIGRPSEIR